MFLDVVVVFVFALVYYEKSRNRISKNSIEYNTVKSKQKKTYGSISKKKNNNKSTNVLNSFKTFDSKFKN